MPFGSRAAVQPPVTTLRFLSIVVQCDLVGQRHSSAA
jgi:hypothetical protein